MFDKNQKQDLLLKIRNSGNIPKHVAIIMDGNRRWAKKNNLAAHEGHLHGAKKMEEIVSIAKEIGIKMLTLYAFSSENWQRSNDEVSHLMNILKDYLQDDYITQLNKENIKFVSIGERAKFSPDIATMIGNVEQKTKENNGLTLCLTLSYGARNEILEMVKKISRQVYDNEISIDKIDQHTIDQNMYLHGYPYPDLVIRSGGEKRISNFLLWYIAYSELYFADKMWPEFTEVDFLAAINDYQLRDRRYGGV